MRNPNTTRILLLSLSLIAALIIPSTPALATTGTCPNEQVRRESNTNPATGQPYSTELPECRAYEVVTPEEKNGQGYSLGLSGEAVAPSGDAVISGAFTELPGSPVGSTGVYVSRRSSSGWATVPLEPVNDDPDNIESSALGATGADFSTVFLGDDSDLVSGDNDANINDLFAVGDEGAFAWISQGENGGVGTAPVAQLGSQIELKDELGGATPNLSHVVFQTPFGTLTSTDTHSYGAEIYDRVNEGSTELVGLLPNDTVPVCGASLGGQQPSGGAGYYGSVSQTGTTVFFQSPDPESESESQRRPGLSACPGGDFTPPQLYARIDDERTVEISAPEAGVTDAQGEQEARYADATPDGAKVFFTSKGTLTSNANTHGDSAEDLYEYEVGAGKPLTDISSEDLVDPGGSQVQGVIGISENGSIVYFVAKGKLTSQAVSGDENLYVSDNGQLTYITALSASDSADWEGLINSKHVNVTPDGAHLLFESVESLSGYSNAGHPELYLLELGKTALTCVSCGSVGSTAQGFLELGDGGRGRNANFTQAVSLTADGSTVFFRSNEALVGGSTPAQFNVYEWHNGELSLIAAGGTNGTFLVGATPNGSDVYFETYESLVPRDRDGGEEDIYDARVDGGFPAPPKAEEGCNSNEACKGSSSSLSVLSPTSLTQTGTGHVAQAVKATTAVTKKKAPPTNAEKLKTALARCKKVKASKRMACEKAAKKKYAPLAKTKAKAKKGKANAKSKQAKSREDAI
jgi:hypothetical protein